VIAITRDVSPSIAQAELTHLERVPIDYERAVLQHEGYRALLRELGCEVISLEADSRHPDCVFIEDTALVLEDLAVITRPGALSRRGEVEPVVTELGGHRRLVHIDEPATLDGGDVLVTRNMIYVGQSARTNAEALEQLRRLTGREVTGVPLTGALHLKTAVTRVSSRQLLVNRDWVDVSIFEGWDLIEIDPSEPFAANAMLVGDVVVHPSAFPLTGARLRAAGLDVRTVDADELAKAEGGVTCCALLLE
jgi:dimethylargininase